MIASIAVPVTLKLLIVGFLCSGAASVHCYANLRISTVRVRNAAPSPALCQPDKV